VKGKRGGMEWKMERKGKGRGKGKGKEEEKGKASSPPRSLGSATVYIVSVLSCV